MVHVGLVGGGSPGLVNSTAGEGARKGELIKMDLTLTSLQEQAHRIAVLHEGTNLSIPAAAPYDLQQPEEGMEGREVDERKGELANPPYRLQELRLVTQSPKGQQEFPQQTEAQEAQHAGYNHNVSLASMTSLRGPSARSNRATVLKWMEPSPTITHPQLVSFPHHAKKWQLGVGKCPGQETIFGLFAISNRTTGIIFRPNQFICPYLGHVQAVKPTKLRHHAWVHNGIQGVNISTPAKKMTVRLNGRGW